jgi:lysosomal-trafficking regulator
MMHPHHKLQTRMQLIKSLLNTPNCEKILKNILLLSEHPQPYTVSSINKLLVYLGWLINLSKNQQEILANNSRNTSHNQQEQQLSTSTSSTNHSGGGGSSSNSSSTSSNNGLSYMSNVAQSITSNDTEILNHLSSILQNLGVDRLSHTTTNSLLANYLNFDTTESISSSITNESYILIQQQADKLNNGNYTTTSNYNYKRGNVDLLNQFDKEFDEEILKIYTRAHLIHLRFLEQFERLTNDLNDFAVGLTNNVVSIHSNVRKVYLLRIKNKRIHLFDVKQRWNALIENIMHEQCIWHDPNSSPRFEKKTISTIKLLKIINFNFILFQRFFILDQTEGPNRERRRMKRSNLYIPERFFKKERRHDLLNEKRQGPLKYLLKSSEDYEKMNNEQQDNDNSTNSTTNNEANKIDTNPVNSISMGDYMLYHLNNSGVSHCPCPCKNVMPYCEIKGELLLSEQRINFAADENHNPTFLMGIDDANYSWSYEDIQEIHQRRYLLKDVGLELFLFYGHTILLAFNNTNERNEIYRYISKEIKSLNKSNSNDVILSELTNEWRESRISNYEYLMQLNKYSGRTFNDLMQYPVYPHVLSNFSSETLDLYNSENYRNLNRPIAAQIPERELKFIENYKALEDAGTDAYHYASLYSNSGTVLHYLVRLPPFTKMFLEYQDKNFDVPDRTFHSMETSYMLSSRQSTTDYKELIPEFFFLHEFFTNNQGFNFGQRQNGDNIDNVILPKWCKGDPRLFVNVMRQALESRYVTTNLNNWIDLIFGYKQSGKAAIDSINCFHPAVYFGYPVDQIADNVSRKAIETMIKTWGQTPKQIFTSPHPKNLMNNKKSSNWYIDYDSVSDQSDIPIGSSKFEKNSIHSLIKNIRWGNYVGSLEQQQSPVCIWKENCKKNIISLVALPNNQVVGLSQQKCLLIDINNQQTGLYLISLV